MAIDKEKVFGMVKDGLNIAKEKAVEGKEKAIVLAQDGSDKLYEAKVELDRKLLNPIKLEEFNEVISKNPRIIRLLEQNPHKEKEACRDAVGFNTKIVKTNVLELVKGEFPKERFTFYPNESELIYLRNPYVEDMYISLNAYFDYIKLARIAELEGIANSLGAKHVKITYKAEEKKFVSSSESYNVGAKLKKGKAFNSPSYNTEANISYESLTEIKIAAESNFEGCDTPIRPNLVYYLNDMQIEGFINAVLGPNPTTDRKLTIKYNRSTDLNVDIAEGIDAVIKKLGVGASASVRSEVEKENRLYLEYEVKF